MNDWEFNVDVGVGDRKEWILRLLYAPTKGMAAESIPGRTRLMKGTFLMKEKLKEEGRHTDFEFRADKYGPLDPKVFDATEQLKDEGLIDIKGGPHGDVYSLTTKGQEEAERLFTNLPEQQQQLLSWLRERHLSPDAQSLSQLLSFIYNQYPDTAKNSELSDL